MMMLTVHHAGAVQLCYVNLHNVQWTTEGEGCMLPHPL
jgi:hypothetical protein